MKVPVIAALTSGSRRISAVPVFWSRSLGANKSGRGSGRLVKAGFRLRADDMAFSAEGGQMSVMSVPSVSYHYSLADRKRAGGAHL